MGSEEIMGLEDEKRQARRQSNAPINNSARTKSCCGKLASYENALLILRSNQDPLADNVLGAGLDVL